MILLQHLPPGAQTSVNHRLHLELVSLVTLPVSLTRLSEQHSLHSLSNSFTSKIHLCYFQKTVLFLTPRILALSIV